MRTLVAEVRDATFASIEDVVAFVTWLDEELSFLVSLRSFFRSEFGNVSLIDRESMYIAGPYYSSRWMNKQS